MRLAWFSAAPRNTPGPSDDTALLVRAVATHHEIDAIDESRAHDFVWRHAREPFDLCVFELGGAPAHDFIAPYAVHYPGLVMLRGIPRHDRAVQAARMVVVPHEPVRQAIADDYPGVRVRTLTPGVEPLPADAPAVISALTWPPDGAALTYAMAGFAAARAVIVFDGPQTADWPSLDPQTWHLRAHRGQIPISPICVSIDPRDEAHSLRLALRRLDGDAALRQRLGAAAQAWWREHATVDRAARGFETLLEEARALPDPTVLHAEDGMGLARRILSEFSPCPWAHGAGLW
jgi:hypothetical protein